MSVRNIKEPILEIFESCNKKSPGRLAIFVYLVIPDSLLQNPPMDDHHYFKKMKMKECFMEGSQVA